MELRPGTCSWGVDVGSTNSEGTLSCFNQHARKEIHRVPWMGDMSDPEHPATSRHSGSAYDFVSSAALMPATEGPGYQLYAGRQSLSEDENFPIKTLLLWAAGIQRKDALQKAPCGQEIIRAAEDGKINKEMVLLVFIDHLKLLYRLACARAKTLGLTIVHISMTHPNFLCDGEELGDFPRWRELVLWAMRQVCGMNIPISTISEGQAMASTYPPCPSLLQWMALIGAKLEVHITEIFDDPLASFDRTKFWDQLRHLNKSEGLPILVSDCGGSTNNMQAQLSFFNNEHEMTSSQSVNHPNWKTGVQGGSHLANFKVRALIEKNLGPNLDPGELAALLEDFEVEKRSLDWTKTPLKTITLHSNNSMSRFPILPKLLKDIFKEAFQAGLDCLQQMGINMLRLKRDFAVVFCGGSYFDKGLRSRAEGVVAQLKLDAARCGVKVESVFLANCDTHWSSGVSAGAALSVLRMPYPADTLDNAAIGLQTQWPRTEGGLVGEDTASFLLSKGCGHLPSITVRNDENKPDPITFTLVCDPVYYRTPGYGSRARRQGTENPFTPIRIERRQHIFPAYEQGFSFSLSDLPPGRVKITMGGADAVAFAYNSESLREKPTLLFELTAYRVNSQGRRMPHALDKRWILRQETDAATKNVIVEDAEEIPPWCLCPGGPQGVPSVHQAKGCPGFRASGRRSDRLASKEVKPEYRSPDIRISRSRKRTRAKAKKTAQRVLDVLNGMCIQVATPPRSASLSPGYESITSMSSIDD